jgi:hypothetical protein
LTQSRLAVTEWQTSGYPKAKPWGHGYKRPRKGPSSLAYKLKYPDASYKKKYSHSNSMGSIRDNIICRPSWSKKMEHSQKFDNSNHVVLGPVTSYKTIPKIRTKFTANHLTNGLPVWQPPTLIYAQACTPILKRRTKSHPTSVLHAPNPQKPPLPLQPDKDIDLLQRIRNLIHNVFNIQTTVSNLISRVQSISYKCPSRIDFNNAILIKLQNILSPLQQGIPDINNSLC